ncbi:PREDICTED: thymopoietin isoform X3 [Gekko japonicus]|uniref:Thymopoietin isoform X3 n=1 Tax=Gekko japonicus TaxID=146911 RepID=A0ABM1KTJ1_GEKJA|nr:PREDICTED: thymopoietin isoform X3 [Gekko japonicus]
MPEFLEDPSVLTKEKLKSELIANNVSLPGGEQRKDVYVQLYLQHLTARNAPGAPAQPDFSSDEERETTPLAIRNRAGGGGNAAVGRKATKKTDKPRPDEKDDIDVTELSNEELKEQLMRYGVNTGPIVATTRKLYEKKLLKLKEQTQELRSLITTPAVSSSAENNKQNGNNDSDQFSDNEEDPQIELKLEKREPLKGRTKVPVTLKQRRIPEHNQVETAVLLPVHDAVMSESTPIAETVVASSNETLQVGNRVPGNVKHADPVLSISDFSKLPRRTPKKPLTTELMEKTPTEERRLERDILKEMFPYEASTPTGISASCRRPIKGAAGRPKELGDFRLEETYSSKYITKYGASADAKAEQPTIKKRSIPMWIKILLFVIVSVFLFLVYQSMETNQGNPFSQFMKSDSQATTN